MGQNHSSPQALERIQKDFRQLIDDERFHDIALECSDGVTIFGYKAILATRSDILNSLIFTGINNHRLSFDKINSNAMKVILDYLYTSVIEDEGLDDENFEGEDLNVEKVIEGRGLNVDNVVEVYYASIYFDLVELQDCIIQFTENLISKDEKANVGKKLLSDCVEKFSLLVDNKMSQILVEWVAKNKLETNEIDDSLTLKGLKYLLMKTYNTNKLFATPESEIWEYALKKATRVFDSRMTIPPQAMYNNQKIRSQLRPLIDCINLNRMDAEEIKKYVEPFNILSTEKLKWVYSFIAMDKGLGCIRGIPIFRWKHEGLSNKLKISDDGFTVESIKELKEPKPILGDLIFKGTGIYEWNISIKKLCGKIYIGICDINENLRYTDRKYPGWVLGSDGYVYYNKNDWKWYDAKFKEGDKVTVHLDMKMKACAFSINKVRKPMVPKWKYNIASKVYPIVSLGRGSIARIEPCIPQN